MTTLPLDVLFHDNGAARGLAATGKAADSAAKSVDKLSAASAKLNAAERKAADAAGAVKLAEIKLQEVRSKSRATTSQVMAAEENLARAKRNHVAALRDVATHSDRVNGILKSQVAQMRSVGTQTEQTVSRVRKLGGGLRTLGSVGVSASGKLVGGLRAVSTGAAGVAVGLGAAGGAGLLFGLKVASGNEQAKIGFTTMLGSARKAEAFLVKLQNFAAKTPFEFPELQKAASGLVAVGIQAKKIIPIMTTIGNVTSGMGTGSEGVQRAVIALQQMSAAGRITAEDLNQLRDAGIPLKAVFQAISERTGTSVKKLYEMRDAGKLGRKELDALMASLESGKGFEKFNGLMAKQSKSLAGMLSTLKDTFGQGLAKTLEAGMPFIKGAIGSTSKVMQAFFNNAQTHSEGMVSGLIGIGNAVLDIGIAFVTMAKTALDALASIGSVWDGLNMFQKDALKKMGIDGSALSAFGKAAKDASNVLGNDLLPKLTAAQEKWVAFGKDQTAKAALRDSIMKTTNAIQGLGNAVDGSKIKMKHWSDRAKLSAVNQSELKNRLQTVKKAFHDQIGAMQANGASHKALVRAANSSRSALAAEFRAMGIGKKEAAELARKILQIPKKHKTDVTANTARAEANIRRIKAGLAALHGKSLTVSVLRKTYYAGAKPPTNPHGADGGMVGRNAIRRAPGGNVPGYSPSSRSDNIPAWLTAGEYVHQVPAVRFWGGGFMRAVNNRDLHRVQAMVGAGGGNTTIIINATHYSDAQALKSALVDMNRRGQLEVIKR